MQTSMYNEVREMNQKSPQKVWAGSILNWDEQCLWSPRQHQGRLRQSPTRMGSTDSLSIRFLRLLRNFVSDTPHMY